MRAGLRRQSLYLLSRKGHAFQIESAHTSMQAVAVALQCLSYDFVGTCLDESSEDLGTIQVRDYVWFNHLVLSGIMWKRLVIA